MSPAGDQLFGDSETAPILKVNGADLSADAVHSVVSVRISRGLRLPGRLEVTFADAGFLLAQSSTFALGTELRVTVRDGTLLFAGEITGVEIDVDERGPELNVIADDLGYRLTLGSKFRAFSNVTYADVVRKIAGEHGLRSDIDATSGTWEHLTQASSDFDLLCDLAERTGFDWWVEDASLHFKKAASAGAALVLRGGEDLRKFSARGTALHAGVVTENGWDPKSKQAVSSTGSAPSLVTTAVAMTPFVKPSALQKQSAVLNGADTPITQSEAAEIASARRARAAAASVTARGVCIDVQPTLRPATKVDIQEVGPASGIYHVTEVTHLYENDRFETRFLAGERVPTGLVDRLGSGSTPNSLHRGALLVGVVTNNNDTENRGRIKVKFPGVDSAVESAWARMIVPDAGPDRGLFFVPEVNDEVVVGFEGGDVRRPVVIGSVYNGRDKPPASKLVDSKVQLRTIRSRLGHQIQLSDGSAPADQYVSVSLKDDYALKLSKVETTLTVPSGTPVILTAGDTKIEMTKDGSIALTGVKISLTAKSDIELDATNIKVKAKAMAEISGVQVVGKATGTAELSATGMTQIKGGMVKIN